MRRAPVFTIVVVLATGGLFACTDTGGEEAGQAGGEGASSAQGAVAPDAVTSTLTSEFETVSGYLLSAAEEVSEEDYSFSPTEEVRDLGGILNHVAGAHYAYCSGASGREAPEAAGEEATTKDEIVEKLRASRDYCLDVYEQTSADALGQSVDVFGSEYTRVGALVQNLAHDNQHYGNIVTYLRSIDMVPPSSQGS